MSSLLWRVIIAVICCLLAFALIPPVCNVVGFKLDSDIYTILKICIGGLAVLYILRGPVPTWNN